MSNNLKGFGWSGGGQCIGLNVYSAMASDIPILNPSLNGIILSVGFLFGQIGQVGQL
jgi:hypothetical protein